MREQAPSRYERLVAAIPPWLILVAGLTLIALVVLTPAWLDLHQLRAKRRIMQEQADRLQEQAHRYELLNQALAANDPQLLERLAFSRLGLKPEGQDVLPPLPPSAEGNENNPPTMLALDPVPPGEKDAAPAWGSSGETSGGASGDISGGEGGLRIRSEPIDRWLRVPPPVVGTDVMMPEIPPSRLTRLSRGWNRVGILVAACICVMGALLWHSGVRARRDRA